MQIMKVDPRDLLDNPNTARRTKSSPQADALMTATIKAVGIIQPPIVFTGPDGGNGLMIENGHRRRDGAIAAGLAEIEVLVKEAANDNGAMSSMVENYAREDLNAVDQWRGIERLVAEGWSEEAIAMALALPVRQVRKLRLLANVLPAMLEQMTLGDMPNEQQLRFIAAASLEEQGEVWKANKPRKGERAHWPYIASALNKRRMFARDASFGDDLAAAYGIEWAEDLFAPGNEDNRYTTNVEAYLGAQHEWMTSNLPKRGAIVEVNSYGEPELPKKAEKVYTKPQKSDHTAMYLDRTGKVQTVHYRMPDEKKKAKAKAGKDGSGAVSGADEVIVTKPRPDVTQDGYKIIGDFRTDALREALGRAPIEDDTLMALLILAFAGANVNVQSPSSDGLIGTSRFNRHAAMLLDENGKLDFDVDTLRVAARSALIDTLSCRRGHTSSGVVARIAGDAIGADSFIANMATEAFVECLSRPALESSCAAVSILPGKRVRETRTALVEHYKEGVFVHPAARFAPELGELSYLLKARDLAMGEGESRDEDESEGDGDGDSTAEAAPAVIDAGAAHADGDTPAEETVIEEETAYSIAAE
ncbi:MAG TPA: ParB N-terminal domain-containing protein [Shinella sp.]|jgi:ParB family chromosome partitioning protein|uniref:ParB N-terminal domain-containing protein n=2 Tax=Rhizobiaceae TaxID=82115 RepID=UPI0007DA7609|nr:MULTISPECIES: ParB N-terminal domain-containing protein [Shinella]ANH09035.1 plasmid partitioning protein [Shinella sp. HZN7]MDC7260357.1 ParB N-terminal domain-containing protein [Shinella sp. YE25]HEV7251382.1 ParB N-terminal domain-containing protein [Shinella sp.]